MYSDILKLLENILYNFPAPISQTQKIEKQNNTAINVSGYNLTKTVCLTTFLYYVSDQPLLLK